MTEDGVRSTRKKVTIIAAVVAGVMTIGGGVLTVGRAALELLDVPARVDSLELAAARRDRVSEEIRLRICEIHGQFPSSCPLFETVEDPHD